MKGALTFGLGTVVGWPGGKRVRAEADRGAGGERRWSVQRQVLITQQSGLMRGGLHLWAWHLWEAGPGGQQNELVPRLVEVLVAPQKNGMG